MDMLNQLGKLVNGDEESSLRREVENAYTLEEPQTSSSLLLERLLLQAEATPQLYAMEADDMTEDTVEATATAAQPHESPSVALQRHRRVIDRVLEGRNDIPAPIKARIRQLRLINWELYHEYIEQNLGRINASSGVKF